ncbi:hypothetical protein [Enterococcus casseliflavus]|uniref:hypothetical protein n=1 Tax=Enterococcus casseliflavus TaxID=37734 RepID=UPI0039A5DB57
MVVNVRVFDIDDDVREEILNDNSKRNVIKLFDKIFEPKNTTHSKISCSANDDSIITTYSKSPSAFLLEKFAEALCKSEKKKDDSRNEQITAGYLFIRQESNKLTLLKLENVEIVDKKNDFEINNNFSTEAKYYKGCIFENNLKNIVIIDKNTTIAKFWKDSFLKLSLNRDSYQNSIELIELIQSDGLFSEKLQQQDNFKDIKKKTENYIFNNKSFSKSRLKELLRDDSMITEDDLNDIYSVKSEILDTDFQMSLKALNKKYKKEILISKSTKIVTNNYIELFNEENIEYKNGTIILTVDNNFISELPKDLIDGK